MNNIITFVNDKRVRLKDVYEASNQKDAFCLMLSLAANNKELSVDNILKLQFERIHPFEDGNGRTGRELINWKLAERELPFLIIEKEDKPQYVTFEADQDYQGLTQYAKKDWLRKRNAIKSLKKIIKHKAILKISINRIDLKILFDLLKRYDIIKASIKNKQQMALIRRVVNS